MGDRQVRVASLVTRSPIHRREINRYGAIGTMFRAGTQVRWAVKGAECQHGSRTAGRTEAGCASRWTGASQRTEEDMAVAHDDGDPLADDQRFRDGPEDPRVAGIRAVVADHEVLVSGKRGSVDRRRADRPEAGVVPASFTQWPPVDEDRIVDGPDRLPRSEERRVGKEC